MTRVIKYLGISVLSIFLLALAFGGGVVVGKERPGSTQPTDIDFSAFWAAWNILDEKFVDSHLSTTTPITAKEVEEQKQERIWGAIAGMTDTLGDPYTSFFPPEEKKNFEESIIGNFGGVGMEIDLRDNVLTVVSALPGTPAKLAGIKSGDQIIKIDDHETATLSLIKAVGFIRGEIGTKVTLKVRRADEPDQFITLTRAKISVPTLDTEEKEGVFIIRLYNFNGNAANNFREALREFLQAKTDKLIIDLRGNPGGLLEAAVDMASWFLPLGQPVVIESRGAGKEEKIYKSYGYDVFTDKLKLAVLIDQGSASASEILAGALSEYEIGTLIGEKSFGKGSVQELVPVTDDSSLKVTIAKWLTPKHKSLVDNGLEPDILVKSATTTPSTATSTDPVLIRAIDFLKQKN